MVVVVVVVVVVVIMEMEMAPLPFSLLENIGLRRRHLHREFVVSCR